jgi:hypothetical protein
VPRSVVLVGENDRLTSKLGEAASSQPLRRQSMRQRGKFGDRLSARASAAPTRKPQHLDVALARTSENVAAQSKTRHGEHLDVLGRPGPVTVLLVDTDH